VLYLACIIAMNHAKGGRQPLFRQMVKRVWVAAKKGSADDLLIACKHSTKAGKKNTFPSGCKNFQQ